MGNKLIKTSISMSALMFAFCLFSLLGFSNTAYADITKWTEIGNMWVKVVDSGDMSRVGGSYNMIQYKKFNSQLLCNRQWKVGAGDWIDENGKVWQAKTSGHHQYNADEAFDTMPIEDDKGITIKRYFRYQPPTVKINGRIVSDPLWPGDEVNPDYINAAGGKGAEMLIESWVQLSIGMILHQKVFAFTNANHDDYVIWDWTFTNETGPYVTPGGLQVNIPQQTLKDVYFHLGTWTAGWDHYYGQNPDTDTLRIGFSYPDWSKADYDDLGSPDRDTGYLGATVYGRANNFRGLAICHVDKAVDDETDDFNLPRISATGLMKFTGGNLKQHNSLDEQVCIHEYNVMRWGYPRIEYQGGWYGAGSHYFDNPDSSERVFHQLNEDERGYMTMKECVTWHGGFCLSGFGPYTLEPGDDFRVVWALVAGQLSEDKRYEIGRSWVNGTCTWDGEDLLQKHSPIWRQFSEKIKSMLGMDDNDIAKDNWVFSQKDSLFKNAYNAKWNVDHNYNVPLPPPPPSLEVWGRPDRIEISWGNESEAAPDFVGYRVYRAVGKPDTSYTLIFETTGTDVHSYDDKTAVPGFSYYYYVAAFDDGGMNVPGTEDGLYPGQSLESGANYNKFPPETGVMLTIPPGKTLDDIRVVPNPFTLAGDNRYPGEENKLVFMGLPPECTIRIFTQAGDLVQTIEHYDGSGIEPWKEMTTSDSQRLFSGLYIAHIEKPNGDKKFVKFIVVR